MKTRSSSILTSLLAALTFCVNVYADEDHSSLYRPLPENVELKISLLNVELPGKAQVLSFLNMGSDDFLMKLAFNKVGIQNFELAKNESDLPNVHALDLSFVLSPSTQLNPYIKARSYNAHKSIFNGRRGKVCLSERATWSTEIYGCLDIILEANRMLDANLREKTVEVSVDLRKRYDATVYSTPIRSTYLIEIVEKAQ